jgi:hypothetical protein
VGTNKAPPAESEASNRISAQSGNLDQLRKDSPVVFQGYTIIIEIGIEIEIPSVAISIAISISISMWTKQLPSSQHSTSQFY